MVGRFQAWFLVPPRPPSDAPRGRARRERAAENVGGSRRRVDALDEGRFAGGITHVGRLGGGILHGAELVRLRVRRREGG